MIKEYKRRTLFKIKTRDNRSVLVIMTENNFYYIQFDYIIAYTQHLIHGPLNN